MPRAKTETASGLSIELSDNAPFYYFGSTVAGHVSFNTASDVSIGVISVRFYGRSKVHYVQHHGEGESHWRGRAPLFSRSLILYEGKHTHKPGSWSWPFEFIVPSRPDEDVFCQKRNTWKARPHYLSTEGNTSSHTLPPTFNYGKWGFGYRFHAYTEYVLEVNFSEPEGTHHVVWPGTKQTILPLKILRSELGRYATPLPGIQFSIPPGLPEKSPSRERISDTPAMVCQTTTHIVKTLKLKPAHRRESLSLRQRANSLFNTNDLPTFAFTTTVSRPDRVHLFDQAGLSFLVNICPVTDRAQTTIPWDEYPDVRIETLSLSLRATTYIRFRCLGVVRHENTSYDIDLLNRHPVGHTVVLSHEDQRTGERIEHSKDFDRTDRKCIDNTVDISKLPGLGVCLTAAKLGKNIESPLTTSFNSYIISREYELRWKLELDVVGQKVKVESNGDKGILILDAKKEQVMQFLSGAQETGTRLPLNEEDDSDSEEEANEENERSESLIKDMSQFLSTRKKKSKVEEAAEEVETIQDQGVEVQDELPRYEAEGELGVPTGSLPKYES